MDITAQFEHYLTGKGVSQKTLRNYRTDLKHFIDWAKKHLNARGIQVISTHHLVAHLTPSLVGNYKGFHLDSGVPHATTNRRLSTLRNFSRFLVTQGLKTEDATEVVENLAKAPKSRGEEFEKVVEEFKKHLLIQNLSKSTLKNYVSDVRNFASWLQSQNRTGWPQAN